MTLFEEKIYQCVRRIPRGRVATYREVAKAAGAPRAFRAVGNALNKNPFAPKVPCHRVVRSDGNIGGFASGTRKKQKLLQSEGVIVKLRKVDLKKFGVKFL